MMPSAVGAKVADEIRRERRLAEFGRRMVNHRISEKRLRSLERKLGSIARNHIHASANDLTDRLKDEWNKFDEEMISEKDIDRELDKLHID